MLIISLIAGFLSTMNLWAVDKNHIRLHINDMYMVFMMTGWMMLLSYFYYGEHMQNANVGTAISLIAVVVVFYCIRTQFLVDDKQFLNGMIPHHSMAILMARNIKTKTKDTRIKKLADDIIIAQAKEIELMNDILEQK